MIPARRHIFSLGIMVLAGTACAQTDSPDQRPPPAAQVSSNTPTETVAASPTDQSPVEFFRKLLKLSPSEQNRLLGGRPPQARARIVAKIREYEALDPQEREMRLRATELRWYLVPLMSASATNQEAGLARVPADIRPLVKSRLGMWSLLPPPLQQEFLGNEKIIGNFSVTAARANANERSEKLAKQFSDFFTITPEEKNQLLNALSEPERVQMENTLKTFDQLPASQRLLCVRNYAKFAGMSEAEKAEFLKNAENWSKMSAEERRAWRDLVQSVPVWPPMPNVMPPLPPLPPVPGKLAPNPGVATN